ncbi:MAG: N-formylglutamate amidohydrolase [Chlamydiales bacterium]|jgi:predicted N-formylglutamate amidohydrolase|nr:N-formylglutamate amidohydrolase [Chlamydiales bacterium]
MFYLIFTCEHGGNEVPPLFQKLFDPHEAILCSHQGWDIGALKIAKSLANNFSSPLFYSTTTRLLVELNRSLHHPYLFSKITKGLSTKEKRLILANYYYPYRLQVESHIQNLISRQQTIVHLSIHSFTPIMGEKIRTADIGLLYDPKNSSEKEFCESWQVELQSYFPLRMKIRKNYPYLGKADGFTSYLRKKFPTNYIGVEVEINQKYFLEQIIDIDYLQQLLINSLQKALDKL